MRKSFGKRKNLISFFGALVSRSGITPPLREAFALFLSTLWRPFVVLAVALVASAVAGQLPVQTAAGVSPPVLTSLGRRAEARGANLGAGRWRKNCAMMRSMGPRASDDAALMLRGRRLDVVVRFFGRCKHFFDVGVVEIVDVVVKDRLFEVRNSL